MKYIFLVPDGMADVEIRQLKGRTPLEVAKTPNMDFLASSGKVGMVQTVPKGLLPASDVANLSLLGYDPLEYYTGRAALEAAHLGINLSADEVAFRCNLITASNDDKLLDYSAGHISTKEAQVLIKFLNKKIGSDAIRFFSGTSYRNLVVINKSVFHDKGKIICQPPHDIMTKPIKTNLPKGKGSQVLIKLMNDSCSCLKDHKVNHVRIDLGENPANMIWLWGEGQLPKMPSFESLFGIKGAVISAVDLIKGIGKIIGLKVIDVPGATGYYDTNFSGKAQYAIDALQSCDFVFVHVEATDEAGHNGDLRQKITMIERFDNLIVGPLLEAAKHMSGVRILVSPDHPTPISLRTHTNKPVPFVIFGAGIEADKAMAFSERIARQSELVFDKGFELIKYLIK
ncbi:MAG: cofactor-independent phosphoglycerate mutase [Candidatus Omnitrophica bacterium]|nr:cofactor-independent phosphoglycerate mutase [Candidatus Omnitrophota bacterium]